MYKDILRVLKVNHFLGNIKRINITKHIYYDKGLINWSTDDLYVIFIEWHSPWWDLFNLCVRYRFIYSHNNLGIIKGMDILESDMSGYTSRSKMIYALNKFLLLDMIKDTFKEKKNANEQ